MSQTIFNAILLPSAVAGTRSPLVQTDVLGGYKCLVLAPTAEAINDMSLIAGIKNTDFASKDTYPVVISLHGFSLRGQDLNKLKRYGLPAVFDEMPSMVEPVLVIAPQLPANKLKWDKTALSALLRETRQKYKVDSRRVYVTGASLGAAGAYEFAADGANQVAGLLIVSGPGDLRQAKELSRVPIWIFHGNRDKTVPLSRSEKMQEAVVRFGGKVKLTVLEGFGHSFDATSTRDIYFDKGSLAWLLSQRLPGSTKYSSTAAVESISSKDQLQSMTAETDQTHKMLNWISALTAFPHRRPGSNYARQASELIEGQFKKLGLTEIQVDEHPFDCVEHTNWSLSVSQAQTSRLRSARREKLDCYPVANSGFTIRQGITYPLVYVGNGSLAACRKADLQEKIVVADMKIAPAAEVPKVIGAHAVYDESGQLKTENYACHFPSNLLGGFVNKDRMSLISKIARSQDAYETAQKKGAAGIVCILRGYSGQSPKIFWPYDATPKSMPALYVSERDGESIRALCRAGGTANLVSNGSVKTGFLRNVSAKLPGPIGSKTILITSHFDSPFTGAVEDASGIAQLLAQASYWSNIPLSKRPGNLVFVACDGHFARGLGALRFAEANADLMRSAHAVLTLEHMPARELRSDQISDSFTHRPQYSHLYVSNEKTAIYAVRRALDANPPLATIVSTPPFDLPLTDCAGFVTWAKQNLKQRRLRYASWISAPVYLIDERDTVDKIDQSRLSATAETVRRLVVELAQ